MALINNNYQTLNNKIAFVLNAYFLILNLLSLMDYREEKSDGA